MGKRLLSTGAGRGRRGFTLIEVMIAMAISVTIMLANLFIFSFAQRTFSESRSLTDATNLAVEKIARFKTKTITQINAENPKSDTTQVNGVAFTRSWTVSNVDVDHDGTSDMTGDIVKIKLDVTWRVMNRNHRIAMATMTTGKPL
jgi:prepilin-type N-terminal cleavage/methylation domain-containing protein